MLSGARNGANDGTVEAPRAGFEGAAAGFKGMHARLDSLETALRARFQARDSIEECLDEIIARVEHRGTRLQPWKRHCRPPFLKGLAPSCGTNVAPPIDTEQEMSQSIHNGVSKVLIDHVVVTVGDQLEASADRYQRLGFHLTERGHHSLGSCNHLAMFETDYLELLGFSPGRETSRAELWRDPPGLTGLVFKPGNPDARYADLQARGVPIEEPLEFSRPVALADGVRDARFRVLRVAPGQVANGRTFFCHHYTPELVWRPEWQQHPNGTIGIAEFIIAARNPGRTAQIYDRMFGPGVLIPTSGGVAFRAGAATVSILDPTEVARRFGNVVEPSRDGGDRMVALALATKSTAQARTHLDRAGIPYEPYDGGIVVSAKSAAGVALVFVK